MVVCTCNTFKFTMLFILKKIRFFVVCICNIFKFTMLWGKKGGEEKGATGEREEVCKRYTHITEGMYSHIQIHVNKESIKTYKK